MKKLKLTAVTSLLLIMTGYGQSYNLRTKNQKTMDTKEIAQNILNTLEKGWNNGNGAEFATPFADTSEFVDIRGTLYPSATRQLIAEAHHGLLMSIYKDSKIVYKLVQAMLIDQNTILANASTELNAPTGPLAGKNASTITLVITKSD
ncbi:MAG: SgcJ/EcaC family oxidoreductase, partial [Saprospiraceae bacterium]